MRIMKDSVAAEESPRKMTTLLRQEGGSAIIPWILVASDDHGIFILPQIEDALIFHHLFKQILLDGEIVMRVEGRFFEYGKVFYYAS